MRGNCGGGVIEVFAMDRQKDEKEGKEKKKVDGKGRAQAIEL